MARTAAQNPHRYAAIIRELSGRLRVFRSLPWRARKSGPDMRLNDGWSPQEVERSWQEYGDGGDSWWAGAS